MKLNFDIQHSIWFSDIDDTLITTAQSTPKASEGIRNVFAARYGDETALKVQQEFNNVFTTMLAGHIDTGAQTNATYTDIIQEINDFQKEVKDTFGRAKLWSREVFIAIAAKRVGITPDPDMLFAAGDAYWMTLSDIATPLPGVMDFIRALHSKQLPLYLVTGSDARMQQKNSGQFIYDPVFSEKFKQERIALLRNKGFIFNLVSIGDPEDKPHKDFFEKAVHVAEKDLGKSIDLSNAVMIGDSYTADLATPKEQMGFGLVVWYKAGMKGTEVIDEHQINTGNLAEIFSYLE